MSPGSQTPSISSLTEEISSLSAKITKYLITSSQPHPTFGADSTAVPDTDEYEALRAPLNDAALDLLRLVNGPERSLWPFFFSYYDLAALQVALDRGFFKYIPLPLPGNGGKSDAQNTVHESSDQSASIEEIAGKAEMDSDRTGRVIRLLAMHRIFQQVPGDNDRFRHTHFKSLRFVVQDISPNMLAQFKEEAIQDLEGRVTFQQHDFFDTQPVVDANAFFLRQCLKNNNDENCVKIICALVPALEKCGKDTPLLINDVIMPESGTMTRDEEHHLRQVDICMMATLGAKQRTEKEFAMLLTQADRRLKIVKVWPNPFGVGLSEVHLDTTDS
ncbi:hypothetical protein J4E91_011077 [Alternaria rosae]|nr:hypothetical protein J4E91_011077 [Alternaria rosae]